MSAPSPRRPSTTVAMRSDSLTRSSLGSAHDRLALGEAAEQRDQRQLVDRQRYLVRLDRRALDRGARDVEVGDRLGRRERADRLELAQHDRAHPLEDPQEAGAGPVDADALEHEPRARAPGRPRRSGTPPRTGRPGPRSARARARRRCRRWCGSRRASPARLHRRPGAQQHPLGVIAGRHRLDHRRGVGHQPGQQHAGLDLGAGDGQLVVDPGEPRRRGR